MPRDYDVDSANERYTRRPTGQLPVGISAGLYSIAAITFSHKPTLRNADLLETNRYSSLHSSDKPQRHRQNDWHWTLRERSKETDRPSGVSFKAV